jgi:two-component system chemotaxis response regulator CheB
MNAPAIVIGGSAGAIEVLSVILPLLSPAKAPPVIVVVHVAPTAGSGLCQMFAARCDGRVLEAEDKMDLEPGTIYFAPGGYHLLLERTMSLALSVDPPVQYARPSIDVLFQSASSAVGAGLVGILLSGANADGADGLERIQAAGGFAIVQDPDSAHSSEMPRAGLKSCNSALVLSPGEIGTLMAAARHGN